MARTPAAAEYRIVSSDSTVHVTNLHPVGGTPNSHCPVLTDHMQGMRVEYQGKTYASAAEATPAFLALNGKRICCLDCANDLSLTVRADANRAAEESIRSLSQAGRRITPDDLRDLTEYTPEELREASFTTAEDAINSMGLDDYAMQFLPRGARGNPEALKEFYAQMTTIREVLLKALHGME